MGKTKKAAKAEEKPEINIIAATIKDGFCLYDYFEKEGDVTGDKVKVKGHGLVEQDMHDAFHKLKIHLAVIDDVFVHQGKEIKNIEKMHNDEIVAKYFVQGFKIKGEEGEEQVILIGTKKVSAAVGEMAIETPAILLDQYSAYPHHKELKSAIEDCRAEVFAYKNGKYTEVEASTSTDENQLSMIGDDDGDNDFEESRV